MAPVASIVGLLPSALLPFALLSLALLPCDLELLVSTLQQLAAIQRQVYCVPHVLWRY
jgi:hypothetical protein